MKKIVLVLTVMAFAFMANAHFTCCSSTPGSNNGSCTSKGDPSHGFSCVSGGCLTDPAWYQLAKKCDCTGVTTRGCNATPGDPNQQ